MGVFLIYAFFIYTFSGKQLGRKKGRVYTNA